MLKLPDHDKGLEGSLHEEEEEMASLRKSALSALYVVIVFLSCFIRNAGAQQVFGSIFGTVTDSSGGVVPKAKVTIKDVAKGQPHQPRIAD